MRIAVMAAGAVGGYFGGRLAAAGHDVFFIARGANLAALKSDGLRIESVHGDLHLPKVNVTDDAKSVGPVDIVLFAVKLWDTETAATATRPLVGAGTRVITLQNGVDSVERVAPILGADRTIGGAAYIASVIAAPGVIKHTSQFARVRYGRADKRADAALQALADASAAAKLDMGLSADINVELWEKFIFLSAMAGATSSLRANAGQIVADPELLAFYRALMQEAYAVGKAKGVALDPGFRRQPHGLSDQQDRARHEGLDGARSRARQPARTRLAFRQGARTRPRARDPDAGERYRLHRAQAVPHGRAALTPPLPLYLPRPGGSDFVTLEPKTFSAG